jgi:hypothetical protein
MPYSDCDMRPIPYRWTTLRPSCYPEIRQMRSTHNHGIKFVKIAAFYECMEILASKLDMQSIIDIAMTCKDLWHGFNLVSEGSYKNWEKMVRMIRLYEPLFFTETRGSKKRGRCSQDDEDHRQEGQPAAKRITSTHLGGTASD